MFLFITLKKIAITALKFPTNLFLYYLHQSFSKVYAVIFFCVTYSVFFKKSDFSIREQNIK
jgi:hypothetical protein